MGDQRYVTEIPSSLKQLGRLVARGFYTIEDALIIDMLVRNPCKWVFQFFCVQNKLSLKLMQAWKKMTFVSCWDLSESSFGRGLRFSKMTNFSKEDWKWKLGQTERRPKLPIISSITRHLSMCSNTSWIWCENEWRQLNGTQQAEQASSAPIASRHSQTWR